MKCRLLIVGGLTLLGVAGCNRADPSASPGEVAGASVATAQPTVSGALRAEIDPTVTLRTSLGTIKVRLNSAKAPVTVDNFLAKVEAGFYDRTIFHQVDSGYVILAGGFQPDLAERKSRYSIPNESHNGLTNRRGTIAMARSEGSVDSATGQFFVNLADNRHLDYQGDSADGCGYCVFGEVVEGMDVVDRIAQSPTRSEGEFPRLPIETVLLESARKVR